MSDEKRGRPKTRGNGMGSIYWHAGRRRWIVSLTLPDGRRIARTADLPPEPPDSPRAPSRRAREQAIAKLRAAVTTAPPRRAPAITVGEWLRAWVDRLDDEQLRPSTRDRYRRFVEYCFLPHLAAIPLDRLTPERVRQLWTTLREEGYGPRTIRNARLCLHRALEEAVGVQLEHNPVADRAARATPPPRREYPLLTGEEYRLFLEAARREPNGAALILALTTGLRAGEIVALRWRYVDLERALLSVVATATQVGGALTLTEPKTAASRRLVALPTIAVEALREHRRRQQVLRQRQGDRWQDLDLVFPGERGQIIRKDILVGRPLARVRRTMEELSGGRVTLPPGFRPHDLRHNCASHLLMRGVAPKIVQELLGHTSIVTTLDIYGHLLQGMQTQAAAAIDAAIADYAAIASTTAIRSTGIVTAIGTWKQRKQG
ncbi:MAG: site-specific integrase [Dehalococcoidia bacterium]|nr:MAG: site-specific integrase [Dehalococcoidia bacterium]